MTVFSETINRQKLQSAVIKWFANEEFSFEQETALANSGSGLATANLFLPGLVVAKVASGAAGSAAAGTNTGNGTCSAVTDQVGAQVGTYEIDFIAATKFNVYDPSGKLVGPGTTGVAFANQIGFTITAGGTAFVAGDTFTIAVAAGSGKIVPLNTSATDGSNVAIGVIARGAQVSASVDTPVVVVERQAVLLADGLIWPSGISGGNKTIALNQLAAAGIIVRNS